MGRERHPALRANHPEAALQKPIDNHGPAAITTSATNNAPRYGPFDREQQRPEQHDRPNAFEHAAEDHERHHRDRHEAGRATGHVLHQRGQPLPKVLRAVGTYEVHYAMGRDLRDWPRIVRTTVRRGLLRGVRDRADRAAMYVDKVRKDAKPVDLPVAQPTTFERVINLRTAKALGLTIWPSLRVRAVDVAQ